MPGILEMNTQEMLGTVQKLMAGIRGISIKLVFSSALSFDRNYNVRNRGIGMERTKGRDLKNKKERNDGVYCY